MSVATGLAVASNYYAQPLLETIARNFSLSASSAGFIVTAAQLGYAVGLLFLVPPATAVEALLLFDEQLAPVSVIGVVVAAVGVALVVVPRSPA